MSKQPHQSRITENDSVFLLHQHQVWCSFGEDKQHKLRNRRCWQLLKIPVDTSTEALVRPQPRQSRSLDSFECLLLFSSHLKGSDEI